MRNTSRLLIGMFLLILLSACESGKEKKQLKGGNKEVLKNWAENIILPAYKNYQAKTADLVAVAETFEKDRNDANFTKLKNEWFEAYVAFQKTMIFDFGISEKIYYLPMANTFPTKVESIKENISLLEEGKQNEIDLEPSFLIKRHLYQGFPALDYLLFADENDLTYYKSAKGKFAAQYIVMLAKALQNNINEVVAYWEKHKDDYINDTDNSVTGAYASTINAFIRVYEKEIRAAKVGYAAGRIRAQSGKEAPEVIEAYYKGDVSKELLKVALESSQDFFNGKNFDKKTKGSSLVTILEDLNERELVRAINSQYEKMYTTLNDVNGNFRDIAVNNNEELKKLYDVIQVNVANYKTKMLAALSVEVGYQDTDGD